MIRIDYQDKRPIYEQVTEKLQNLIVKGVMVPDEKLPSVRALAMELSINPNTIQRSYTELEKAGFIYTVKGRGNFVSDRKIWISDEKEDVLRRIKESICAAIDLGVSRQEIKEYVVTCCEEGKE